MKPSCRLDNSVSAEVAPCAVPLGGGAAGSWWEEEIWTKATMAAVTIYPPSLSLSGRIGTTTVLPHSDPTQLPQTHHPEPQGAGLVPHPPESVQLEIRSWLVRLHLEFLHHV